MVVIIIIIESGDVVQAVLGLDTLDYRSRTEESGRTYGRGIVHSSGTQLGINHQTATTGTATSAARPSTVCLIAVS